MSDPYGKIIDAMRKQGAWNNAPDLQAGTVQTTAPLRISMGGAIVTADYVPAGVELGKGDAVVAKVLGGKVYVIAKVVAV